MNRIALAAVAFACLTAPTRATIHSASRMNHYSLSFDNDSFDNTIVHLSIRQDRTADAPGDSRAEAWNLFAGSFNVSWEAFGGIVLTDVVLNGQSLTGTIVSPDGLPGYTVLRNDAPPNVTNLDVGVLDGQAFLKVQFQSGGGVDPGYPSLWQMAIPGDWSQSGTGVHEHELVSYDPRWTLTRDFEYDSNTDTTTFELATDAYEGPPSPFFFLHGALEGCIGDFNGDGQLNLFDFLAFQDAFGNDDLAADLAPPFGVLNLFDFLAFQTAFSNGC